jgi:hyperosmotically inducible periplasmic protein
MKIDSSRFSRIKINPLSGMAAVAVLALTLFVSALSSASGAFASPLSAVQNKNNDQRSADYITREVRHNLLLIPYYSVFDNLEYRVDGSTVTLMGQVISTHGVIKDDAEAAVKKIEGVDKVVNNIEILPPSPDDDQIRFAEYRAIYSFPSLQKYGFQAVSAIHIIVKGGHVTLEGVVDNQADKDAANIRANSVPNVFSVTNNLKVVTPSK